MWADIVESFSVEGMDLTNAKAETLPGMHITYLSCVSIVRRTMVQS